MSRTASLERFVVRNLAPVIGFCSDFGTNPPILLDFVFSAVHSAVPLPRHGINHLGLEMSDRERDQRTGSQWLSSVKAYLLFCSGTSWRPARDRFHPVRFAYTSAINWLNEADNSLLGECSCCYCQGAPFYDARLPRKQPGRVVAIAEAVTA